MAEGERIRFVTAAAEIEQCIGLRWTVFVEEQGISAGEEMDGRDGDAEHVLATLDGRAVGTARVRRIGDVAKIERVCVARECRGTGLGKRLMEVIMARMAREPGVRILKLGSQTSAAGFYRRLGFAARGPEFMDAGIPHVEMVADAGDVPTGIGS